MYRKSHDTNANTDYNFLVVLFFKTTLFLAFVIIFAYLNEHVYLILESVEEKSVAYSRKLNDLAHIMDIYQTIIIFSSHHQENWTDPYSQIRCSKLKSERQPKKT